MDDSMFASKVIWIIIYYFEILKPFFKLESMFHSINQLSCGR